MKENVVKIIQKQPITQADLDGYPGYAYKSEDCCIFEQIKCTDNDIFGHDSYESFCTRSGETKSCCSSIVCNRCQYKTTVKDYKEFVST